MKTSNRVGIRTCSDYSPFGVELDGRTVSGGYRYGFNGNEKTNEILGEGNSYDFGARMLDSRIGRWMSSDPLQHKSPNFSSYNFVFNNPIIYKDPDGEYPLIVITAEVTGYTIARIYGVGTVTCISVKTYKAIVYDVNKETGKRKELGSFNVTRDGFYDLGTDSESQKSVLVNRASEPLKDVTVEAISTHDYADTYGAYALAPFDIEPLPIQYDKFKDGRNIPVEVKRENPKKATNVMIHIGGYFTKKDGTLNAVGGTYGCYGIVDPSQVLKTSEEASILAKRAINVINDQQQKTVLNGVSPSNNEQNRFVNTVNKAISLAKDRNEKKAGTIHVHIKKNENRTKVLFE
jgi:RHS repeat-associated protein